MKELETLRTDLHKMVDEKINALVKPKFEINKWYKGGSYMICPTDLSDPNNAKGYGLSSEKWRDFHSFGMNGVNKMIEATPSEVLEALTGEAVKKEYIGNKITADWIAGNKISSKLDGEIVFRDNELGIDTETDGYYTLMRNGIWAEIIPEPKTLESFAKDFQEYSHASDDMTRTDFNSFLKANAPELIECLTNLPK